MESFLKRFHRPVSLLTSGPTSPGVQFHLEKTMKMRYLIEKAVAHTYYHVKPFMSRELQIDLRSIVARYKRFIYRGVWPIDPAAGTPPAGFGGWPGGKQFAVVMTHDVDTARGAKRCEDLMKLEMEEGFRSSYFFVALDYDQPPELRRTLVSNGFEVGLHGLEHNRKLWESRSMFDMNAVAINSYLKDWGGVGFRAPCVYHNFEWLHGLNIAYDASSFDTDPFEPQSDGLGTIFPLHQKLVPGREYVELPYTLPQDFTLYVLFKEKDIRVWKEKLRWIAERGGMALLITHPDYMSFGRAPKFDEYSPDLYRELLQHIKTEYKGLYWQPLPHQMASFWRENVRR
jgi:peptidoglycan/xylan/chitin deacetylase (PgdA/CDA1 family)